MKLDRQPIAQPNRDLCTDAQARQFSGCVVMMRERLRMSYSEIARRVGVSCGALERIAAGVDRPSVKQLGEVWKALLMETTRHNEGNGVCTL